MIGIHTIFGQKNNFSINTGFVLNTSAKKDFNSTFLTRRSPTARIQNSDGFLVGLNYERNLKQNYLTFTANYLNQGFVVNDELLSENRTRLHLIQPNLGVDLPIRKNFYAHLGMGSFIYLNMSSKSYYNGELVGEGSIFFGQSKEILEANLDRTGSLNLSFGLKYRKDRVSINFLHHSSTRPILKPLFEELFLSNVEIGIVYNLFRF